MVGNEGFEPPTFSTSRRHSPTELIARNQSSKTEAVSKGPKADVLFSIAYFLFFVNSIAPLLEKNFRSFFREREVLRFCPAVKALFLPGAEEGQDSIPFLARKCPGETPVCFLKIRLK